jgi:hypothetical protein
MVSLDQVAKIANILLTPILGIVGTWILINQYRLLHARWKLDLYDKRYPVFLATIEHLDRIVSLRPITFNEAYEFLNRTKSFAFLFGADVKNHINALYKESQRLAAIESELTAKGVGQERTNLVNQKQAIIKWMLEQYEVTSLVFGRYLKIDRK